MALELKPFDPADYLNDHGTASEYLRFALESNDPREIVDAIKDVARARGGIAKLAKDSGFTTEFLRQALGENGNPDLITLTRLLHSLGVTLSIATTANESVAA